MVNFWHTDSAGDVNIVGRRLMPIERVKIRIGLGFGSSAAKL